MPRPPLEFLAAAFRSSRGTGLKRIIILPSLAILLSGFAVSFLVYLSASRAAIGGVVTALAAEGAERVITDALRTLERAMTAARSNAALLGRLGGSARNGTILQRLYLDQLAMLPQLSILSTGFADGEYAEAQRLADGSFRVAEAGAATGGALRFRSAGMDAASTPGRPLFERPDYDPRARPWYREAAAAGGPRWSEAFALYSDSSQAIAAAVPFYGPDGDLAGVASATLEFSGLSRALEAYREASRGLFLIVDPRGLLLACSLGPTALSGSDGHFLEAASHPEPRVAALARAAGLRVGGSALPGEGRFTFSLNGESYSCLALRHRDDYGLDWLVLSALRDSAYALPLARADRLVLAALVLFISAAFVAGWLAVGAVSRPMRLLGAAVAEFELGSDTSAGLERLAGRRDELGRLSQAFLGMKRRLDRGYEELGQSLAEKDLLLKEVHHRVKNNLQIVSSILSLQSSYLPDDDTREAFEQCQERIQAMALVHEQVYRGADLESLDLGAYLERICEALLDGRGDSSRIALRVEVSTEARTQMEQAIPLGLIVNELVTNALKYAFPVGRSGTIAVTFRPEGECWELRVSDDGIGLEPGAEPSEGVGGQLVEGLVGQLRGKLERSTGPMGVGLVVSIRLGLDRCGTLER